MSDKETIEFKSAVSSADAAGFLESLAKSLRKGSSLLESGDQSLGLRFGPEMLIELEAQSDAKKGKGSLQLELKWRAEQNGAEPTLTIVPGAIAPAAASAD